MILPPILGSSSTRPPFKSWVLGGASLAVSLVIAIEFALHRQIDLQVYRMGGELALSPRLYSSLTSLHLPFTYPPFAALLFWPLGHLPSRASAVLWALVNLGALVGLLVVSLRAVRPGLGRARIWLLALIGSVPAALLNPILITNLLGQVNVLLVFLVVADLTGDVTIAGRRLPKGVLVGLAGAIKLTPLIFVPFLFLAGQRVAARWATTSFLAASGLAAVLSWHSSWMFWTKEFYASNRAGNPLFISNQNLMTAVDRLSGHSVSGAWLLPLYVVIGAGGVVLAARAYRSSPLLGVLVCATTGLLVSPVSWAHHYVWSLPIIVWLALAEDRPALGPLWALATSVLFWVAPIWFAPDHARGMGGPGAQALGNSYVFFALAFLFGVATMLTRRSRATGTERALPAKVDRYLHRTRLALIGDGGEGVPPVVQ